MKESAGVRPLLMARSPLGPPGLPRVCKYADSVEAFMKEHQTNFTPCRGARQENIGRAVICIVLSKKDGLSISVFHHDCAAGGCLGAMIMNNVPGFAEL